MVNGISVSEVAALKLKEVMSDEGQGDSYLRIVVMPGAGGGAQYMLSLEEDVKSTDSIIDASGVGLVVDNDSLPLLDGSEIDYVDGLMRSGFVINNPNFLSEGGGGCGCGGGGCGAGAQDETAQGASCACGGGGCGSH
jgi:iron-sulfur cluster assembly accessory protein|tara:strand:+ start:1344 stop:1757 length:414 start_codon:yes stop_codon:yes gene_type:complete